MKKETMIELIDDDTEDVSIDKRTEKYLRDAESELKCTEFYSKWYDAREMLERNNMATESGLVEAKRYKGFIGTSDIIVYRYVAEGIYKYRLEFYYKTNDDKYCLETYLFDKLPSKNDIVDVKLLSDIDFSFKFRELKAEFNCKKCNRQVHWLDVEGNLEEKYEKLKDRYCGC